MIDGGVPEEGISWDSPLSVVLTTANSSIVVEVPRRDLAGVILSSDGNDLYTVRCADDGRWLGALGAALASEGAPGMRTRLLFTDAIGLCSAIRVSASGGDGRYSVAEIGFISR